MKMKTQQPKIYGIHKSSANGKVQSPTTYLKKQEKCQINNLTLYLKQLGRNEEPQG